MLAVLLLHAHGHADPRGVKRPGTLGSILGDGILAPDDEAGDVGHFDELGDGGLLLPEFHNRCRSFRKYVMSKHATEANFQRLTQIGKYDTHPCRSLLGSNVT